MVEQPAQAVLQDMPAPAVVRERHHLQTQFIQIDTDLQYVLSRASDSLLTFHLAALVQRLISWQGEGGLTGVTIDGQHYIRLTAREMCVIFPTWRRKTPQQVLKLGRDLGVLKTQHDPYTNKLRLNTDRLRQLYLMYDTPLPASLPKGPSDVEPTQLSADVQVDIEAAEKSATPSEKSATPSEKSATPSEKSATPSEKSATPSEKSATPSEKSATLPSQNTSEKPAQNTSENTPPSPPRPSPRSRRPSPRSRRPSPRSREAGGEGDHQSEFQEALTAGLTSFEALRLGLLTDEASAWQAQSGRAIAPQWAEALWELGRTPGIRTPFGFMTSKFRAWIEAGIDLSSPPVQPPPRRRASDFSERPPDEGAAKDETSEEPPPPADPKAVKIWSAVLGDLEMQVTRPSFETWLTATEGYALDGDLIIVMAPNAFVAEMLDRRMRTLLEEAVARVARGEIAGVELVTPQTARRGLVARVDD